MVKKKSKKEKVASYIRKKWGKAATWLSGLIIGLLFTKACDRIWPDTPVVVKEQTDTVKIIHSVDPLQVDSDSTIRKQLEYQLKNIELLNKYEKQITSKREAVKANFCKLITGRPYPNSHGYSTQKSSSYGIIEMNINDPYIDISYDFFREDYIDLINTLCVKVCRKDDKNGRDYIVMDTNYEPNRDKNDLLIRMVNDFPPGEYTLEAGFILKENRLDEYPVFYRQTFVLKK